jgi:hypothetical protein
VINKVIIVLGGQKHPGRFTVLGNDQGMSGMLNVFKPLSDAGFKFADWNDVVINGNGLHRTTPYLGLILDQNINLNMIKNQPKFFPTLDFWISPCLVFADHEK